MHTRPAEIVDRICAVLTDAENEDEAAGLVLAEERACLAADDDDGEVLLIGLHVDAAAVAAGVADVAVDDDVALVHRVADRLLCVAEHLERRAVEVLAETVARGAVYRDIFARGAAANVALADHVLDRDAVVLFSCLADLFVYLLVIGKTCLNCRHQCAPPNFFARSACENAMSCGLSRMSSKSMVSSGVCSRMSEV